MGRVQYDIIGGVAQRPGVKREVRGLADSIIAMSRSEHRGAGGARAGSRLRPSARREPARER